MSDEYRRIEVITGTARRRRWSVEDKLRILGESCEPGESVSAVARRHGVAPNLLYRWRRLVNQGGVAAVESRFGTLVVPHAFAWLSDHGSPYTAKDTRDFACALGLQPCFTPVASPESNGLAEALVRTFKRDCVRINPLPDALTVLRQLHRWFADYNDNHPHSGLGMRSPRDFIRAHSPTATCPI